MHTSLLPPPPAFREALKVWFRIGCLSFGGPAGQIALMHRIVIDDRKWVPESQYLHALNFCMLLPGPEAAQLATYCGWLLHGLRGGLAAGLLFVLPGAVVMLGLSLLYVYGQGLGPVDGALFGIKAAVLVIVVEALLRISKRALKSTLMVALAALAFISIYLFALPFPLIVGVAALIGYAVAQLRPELMGLAKEPEVTAKAGAGAGPRSLVTLVAGLAIWWAPVLLVLLLLGPNHVLMTIGLFFSKLAVVTFGGAYAVLAYMAQQAVEMHGWLAPREMVDGLGLAETTPGPLILVTQFVGFLAAFREAAPFTPLVAGLLGAALTTWVTFVPALLWIFAGAPYIEKMRGNRRLAGALAAITAAVVGVILNLSLWFALHVLFGEVTETRIGIVRWFAFDPKALDRSAAILAITAAIMVFRFHRSLIEVIGVMAVLGIITRWPFG